MGVDVSNTKGSGFCSYPLRYLALGLLMREPGYGYQLDQTLDEDFRMIWKAGQTKLYVTLSQLEEEGLLRSEMEPQENRPDRKVFHITDSGREEFMEWVKAPVRSMRAVRVELIAKLRFFYLIGLTGVETLIQKQVETFRDMIREWEGEKEQEQDPFLRQVYAFRIQQATFIIDWLQDYEENLT